MPKSNRKGYFVQKLREEGFDFEPVVPNPKGIKKEAKVAAKEARERKKAYIMVMEKRHLDDEQKIERLQLQNQRLQFQCARLREQLELQKNTEKRQHRDNQIIVLENKVKDPHFEGLPKQMANLKSSIESENKQQLARCLSVLRDKFGISGRERLNFLEEQFYKIVHTLMPLHFRLLLESSADNQQFYKLLVSQHSNRMIKFGDKQKQILLQVRPQVIRQRVEYDRILGNLREIRDRLKEESKKSQDIIDRIEQKMGPMFTARLLIDLDFRRMKDSLDRIYPVNFYERRDGQGQNMEVFKQQYKQKMEEEEEESLFLNDFNYFDIDERVLQRMLN